MSTPNSYSNNPIPSGYTGDIYFYWNLRYGWLQIATGKFDSFDKDQYVLLGTISVDVKFPDVTQAAIEGLEAMITAVRATAQATIQGIEEKIESLRALEYRPATTQDIYTQNGYGGRDSYLQSLSEDFGVPLDEVKALADLLGPDEDFDGLVSSLEEHSHLYD